MKMKKMFSADNKFFTFIIPPVFCLIMIFSKVEGQTSYYFSSSKGDDSRTNIQAKHPATPWRTIDKLNSFFESISPGDSILFKRGDTFYGSLVVNKSGTNGNPIVISAYGSGPKPVISGFSTISSWTSLGNNIYEATVPYNRKTVNCIVINGELQPIARYPKISDGNGGFLDFESHSGDGQITDNQLADFPDWTGGEIVIRKNHWVLDRTHIISHKGNVIDFTPVTTFYKLIDGSGYFIQNHPSALKQNGDWCYDDSNYKIKIFYSTVPPAVQVSTLDQLMTVISNNYIKISDISFEGANTKAVYANNVVAISMDNCNVNFSGTYSVHLNQMSGDVQFNNNTISNSLNNAVSISSKLKDSYCTIRNNTITNTGMIAGMSGSGDGNCNGFGIFAENGAIIEYNTIKNTGYIPLNFNGNNILIKNNVIDNYSFVKDDAAGIYTYNGGLPVRQYRNRVITGNIVSNGIGNPYGNYSKSDLKAKARGIYMDNNVNHVEITDNTVFNISAEGNHNNSPSFITMTGNTFFNIATCYDLVRWVNDGSAYQGGQDITNLNFQHNIFFTTSAEQKGCYYRDQNVNYPATSSAQERISAVGIIDNNYYHLPNKLGFGYLRNTPISFDTWKSLTGFEKNGKIITTVPLDQVRFEVNATKEVKTVKLVADYTDVDGKHYSGSIALQPFSSKVLILSTGSASGKIEPFEISLPKTEVRFKTSDLNLQKVFDEAESKAELNIANFGDYRVLIEGGGYNFVWLETQPMGGSMYAKRNLEIARNNIQIFIDLQREDGRFPGMITHNSKTFFPGIVTGNNSSLSPVFGWFQGYCLPMPAFEVYFWLKKDKEFLRKLYNALEKFDNYLWKTRDSDHNGCLETWCVFDTGEDNALRFGESPYSWPFDYPPTKELIQGLSEKELNENLYDKKKFDFSKYMPVPIESMDIMSYSYTGRDVLSLISKELGNGKERYWRNKANEVRRKIKDYLWDKERHACYDRDNLNKTMNVLVHNNLRCMYYGSFDQQMADEFVKYHLLNPEEFWTPMPLPSIAVNDPLFRNIQANDWSGQPEALTYQRSIRALENYGHYAELTMIGTKFLKVIGDSLKFTQQFDPFTQRISTATQNNGYGPGILASLEFISRLYGIHLTLDKVLWTCLDNSNEYNYSQEWDHQVFKMMTKGDQVFCFINGIEVFSFTKGIRVVSDINGKILKVEGIETKDVNVTINYAGKIHSLSVAPNVVYSFNNKFIKERSIGFSKPDNL